MDVFRYQYPVHILSYLTNSYILTDYVYHRGLSEHMTAEKITSF